MVYVMVLTIINFHLRVIPNCTHMFDIGLGGSVIARITDLDTVVLNIRNTGHYFLFGHCWSFEDDVSHVGLLIH